MAEPFIKSVVVYSSPRLTFPVSLFLDEEGDPFALGVKSALALIEDCTIPLNQGRLPAETAVLADEERLPEVLQLVEVNTIVVVVNALTPAQARNLLRMGAAALLERTTSIDELVSVLENCRSGNLTFLPRHVVKSLASRLREPPRNLSKEERTLLGLVTSMTLEEAGAEMGWSRRQIQRHFSRICVDLGLSCHRDAIVAAALWGLNKPSSDDWNDFHTT